MSDSDELPTGVQHTNLIPLLLSVLPVVFFLVAKTVDKILPPVIPDLKGADRAAP
jgi:hypothetical protein